MVDLLPEIDVVAADPFNSHPTEPSLMGPSALERFVAGEALPVERVPTPLVLTIPQPHAPVAGDLWQQPAAHRTNDSFCIGTACWLSSIQGRLHLLPARWSCR
jgi:hypothetical protein